MRFVLLLLLCVSCSSSVLDKQRIYACSYYGDSGFLEWTGEEWQCIPCLAAMDADEIDLCNRLKGGKKK